MCRLLSVYQETLDWPEDSKINRIVEQLHAVLEERQNETYRS